MLLDDLMKGVGEQAPQCMLLADDVTQKGETLVDLENHLGHLQQALEPNGLRISREKFNYLRPVFQSNMDIDADVGSWLPSQESPYCSPYKPVPLPKPVPPPYRQPPRPVPGTSSPSCDNPASPPYNRLSNIDTASVHVPGSTMPEPNPIYVTHSAKFPIHRERDISGAGDVVKGNDGYEFRIPKLSEVQRMQWSKNSQSSNSESRPFSRAQQAWTEDSKHKTNGVQEGIQHKLRHLLGQSSDSTPQLSYSNQSNRPVTVDDGEPLLVRSRSGPIYPLGIENASMRPAGSSYMSPLPHPSMKENDGPDGGERRATAMTPAFREQRDVYRAHCIKTKSDDGNPKESDPDPDVLNSAAVEWQSNNGAALNPPAMPLQSSSKYNLRDACSRLYQQHHGAGKKTIHSSMQSLKGSMSSLNLVCKNVHIGEEGPYGSCKDMTRAESQQHPQAPSSIKQNNVLWEDSWADVATGASASVSVDPNNSTGQLALGPQGYYHLKDMVSGANGQQSHQEAKKGLPTEDIYGQRGPSTGPFSIQSDKHSTKRDKVYGVIGKFGASPEDGAAIYVPLRPQISSDPNVMDTKKCSSSSNDENKSKIPDKNAENRVASLHHLPVSTSSTSSESGHGTMQTGAPSTKSGSTLNTSSESEILLGEHSTTAVPSESQRDEGSPETGSEVPRRSDASVPKSVSIRVDYNDRQLEAASHPLWNSAADHKYSGSSQPTALQKQRIGSSSGMLDLERGSRETLLSKRDNFNLHESTFSDSFSITPPLPPLSPPNTPPRSPSTSSGRIQAKYKLSVSAGNLRKGSGSTPDILEKRDGPLYSLKDATSRSASKKSGSKSKSSGYGHSGYTTRSKHGGVGGTATSGGGGGGVGVIGSSGKYSQLPSRVPVHSKGSGSSFAPRTKGSQISLAAGMSLDSHDGEVTSTTTGLDMDSLLDDADLSTEGSSRTSHLESGEVHSIRRQLESLEGMYSEVMKMLGIKGNASRNQQLNGQRSLHDLRPLRRKVFGSLSSLTGKGYAPSGSGRNATSKERQSQGDRKKGRDSKGIGRRFQRLESHVVTLARSVAHLSSEMRTQHIMFQELENLRQEVAQLHDQQMALRTSRLNHAGGCNMMGASGREWDNFRSSIPSLTNPARVKKLTKFFGDEPPLLRLFLKKLGYEKYASQFESERIGIIELPYLTEERLQKIGIPMGPRMRILQEAQMSFRQEHFNIYIV